MVILLVTSTQDIVTSLLSVKEYLSQVSRLHYRSRYIRVLITGLKTTLQVKIYKSTYHRSQDYTTGQDI